MQPESQSGAPVHQDPLPESLSDQTASRPRKGPQRQQAPLWLAGAPFFLSALLFLSGFFSIFAAIPFQVLFLGKRWRSLFAAILLNSVWVGALGGASSLFLFVVYGVVPGIVLGASLARFKSVTSTLLATLAAMVSAAFVGWVVFALRNHLNILTGLGPLAQQALETVQLSMGEEARQALIGEIDPKDWQWAVISEMPSAFLLFGLVQAWVSLMILIRGNPSGSMARLGIKPDALLLWKTPETWVWPLIAVGAAYVMPSEWGLQVVASNLLRVILGFYALQGTMILSALLDAWSVRGLFRGLVFTGALFFMLPLVIAAGVFDLWFDFRKNLRQST